MKLRIISWNINSIRKRIDLLHYLTETYAPDVVCLQETKVQDPQFPHKAVAELGYAHRFANGISGYNGVAILSRHPLDEVQSREWCDRADGRHIQATLRPVGQHPGVEIHNFYVPAGGDEPDPEINDKFAHKLHFMSEMALWGAALPRNGAARILVGDLNVAPLETDVWSHKQLLKVVSHTPIEVDHLDRVRNAHEWVDAVREFVPPETNLYSWWSYRARDWSESDRGRRLDHIWVTPSLKPALRDAMVLRDARGWSTPSDHVPVLADFEL